MPLTVLVTGANRGLGLEFVRQLKQAGHTVIGTARDPGSAGELTELLASAPAQEATGQESIGGGTAEPAATSGGTPREDRNRWPLIGMIVPASIFLFATWVTTALHRHFTGPGGSHAEGQRP